MKDNEIIDEQIPVPDYPDWRKDDKTLTNAGLPEEERDWFCDARPQKHEKSWHVMENS